MARPGADPAAVGGAAGVRRAGAVPDAVGGRPGAGVRRPRPAGGARYWLRPGAAAADRDRPAARLVGGVPVHAAGPAVDGERLRPRAAPAAGFLPEAAPG